MVMSILNLSKQTHRQIKQTYAKIQLIYRFKRENEIYLT